MEKTEYRPIKEIAEHLGMTEQTIYNWIKDGCHSRKVKEIGRRTHTETRIIDIEEYHKTKGTA